MGPRKRMLLLVTTAFGVTLAFWAEPAWASQSTTATLHAAPSAAASPVVHTDKGAVRGTSDDGVDSFLGIPYAAPRVGPLRWRAPQPAPASSGIRDATHDGDRCAA